MVGCVGIACSVNVVCEFGVAGGRSIGVMCRECEAVG
jgi:hypothetical protein